MKKTTAKQKQIIDAHLNAAATGTWDIAGAMEQPSKEAVIQALKDGKTIWAVHEYVQSQSNISVTSLLMASVDIFGHQSQAYKRKYTRTFFYLLDNAGIR